LFEISDEYNYYFQLVSKINGILLIVIMILMNNEFYLIYKPLENLTYQDLNSYMVSKENNNETKKESNNETTNKETNKDNKLNPKQIELLRLQYELACKEYSLHYNFLELLYLFFDLYINYCLICLVYYIIDSIPNQGLVLLLNILLVLFLLYRVIIFIKHIYSLP